MIISDLSNCSRKNITTQYGDDSSQQSWQGSSSPVTDPERWTIVTSKTSKPSTNIDGSSNTRSTRPGGSYSIKTGTSEILYWEFLLTIWIGSNTDFRFYRVFVELSDNVLFFQMMSHEWVEVADFI